MADWRITKGDVGIVFEVDFLDRDGDVIDISASDTITIDFLKPDGTTSTVTASYVGGSGTDGKLTYTSVAADLDTAGTWQYQGKAVRAASAINITTPRKDFVVNDRIV